MIIKKNLDCQVKQQKVDPWIEGNRTSNGQPSLNHNRNIVSIWMFKEETKKKSIQQNRIRLRSYFKSAMTPPLVYSSIHHGETNVHKKTRDNIPIWIFLMKVSISNAVKGPRNEEHERSDEGNAVKYPIDDIISMWIKLSAKHGMRTDKVTSSCAWIECEWCIACQIETRPTCRFVTCDIITCWMNKNQGKKDDQYIFFSFWFIDLFSPYHPQKSVRQTRHAALDKHSRVALQAFQCSFQPSMSKQKSTREWVELRHHIVGTKWCRWREWYYCGSLQEGARLDWTHLKRSSRWLPEWRQLGDKYHQN